MRHISVIYDATDAVVSSVEHEPTEWMQPNDVKQGEIWKGHLSFGVKWVT